jgi:hypothetical protein
MQNIAEQNIVLRWAVQNIPQGLKPADICRIFPLKFALGLSMNELGTQCKSAKVEKEFESTKEMVMGQSLGVSKSVSL